MPLGTIPQLVSLINKVYDASEAGLWLPGWVRVSPAELSLLITSGEVIAAYQDTTLVGVIHLYHDVGQGGYQVGGFGMLAVPLDQRGTGAGRALVQYAEQATRERGIRFMQLELLTPKNWKLDSKEFLLEWYGRLGYKRVGFGQIPTSMLSFVATESDFSIFQKPLYEK